MSIPRLALKCLAIGFVAGILFAVTGCKHSSSGAIPGGATQSFTLRGKVISTNASSGEVTLDHEAVAGFMEGMTMPYKVADPSTLSELHPGDRITTRLQVEKDSDGGFHHPRLDQIVVIAQARPDYKPATQYNVPAAGESVPDFKLVNQGGHTIHLSSYRGKALLITFIYTRCPLSDFCPRMSHNFHQIDDALLKDSASAQKTHLLSISFDPAFDVPSVLEKYGRTYISGLPAEHFQHWEFAAAAKDDLKPMEQFFNVGVTGSDSTLMHSLSTVLIGPDGKIQQWFPGNDWAPAQVIQQMQKSAGIIS